jgi:hypothetical protein
LRIVRGAKAGRNTHRNKKIEKQKQTITQKEEKVSTILCVSFSLNPSNKNKRKKLPDNTNHYSLRTLVP